MGFIAELFETVVPKTLNRMPRLTLGLVDAMLVTTSAVIAAVDQIDVALYEVGVTMAGRPTMDVVTERAVTVRERLLDVRDAFVATGNIEAALESAVALEDARIFEAWLDSRRNARAPFPWEEEETEVRTYVSPPVLVSIPSGN
jgi:hypothetical protein